MNTRPDNSTACFLHTDRPATRALNIPCAPGGKVWVCDECHAAGPASDLRKQLFDKYLAGHTDRVIDQRARDAVNRVREN